MKIFFGPNKILVISVCVFDYMVILANYTLMHQKAVGFNR